MTKLAIHDLSRKKSPTKHKNNMINLTAKMQAVIEEITLDVRDFLSGVIGQTNTPSTQDSIQSTIQDYLSLLEEIQVATVICDSSNNTHEDMVDGRLNVDILFTTAGSTFEGNFKVVPAFDIGQAEITHDFFLLHKYQPTPVLAMIQLDDVLKAAENIPASEQEVEIFAEMPSALASSLKV